MPRIASDPSASPQPISGLIVIRPRIPSINCVPACCVAWPTAKKIADLVSECTVMCNNPAKVAIGPPMPNAKVMMPMCSIDEYANSRLMSFCRDSRNAATMTDSRPNPIINSLANEVCSDPSTSTLQRTTA